MNKDALLTRLSRMIEHAGGQRALARSLGVSPSYLHDVIRGRREPAGKLLAALGLKRTVRYEAL